MTIVAGAIGWKLGPTLTTLPPPEAVTLTFPMLLLLLLTVRMPGLEGFTRRLWIVVVVVAAAVVPLVLGCCCCGGGEPRFGTVCCCSGLEGDPTFSGSITTPGSTSGHAFCENRSVVVLGGEDANELICCCCCKMLLAGGGDDAKAGGDPKPLCWRNWLVLLANGKISSRFKISVESSQNQH